ncbi:hypothetical protein N431DRAFT_505087 [Stipitochalara longipes BDJ]|nr:hypothetical protein N431DRAFT_505087 [Stipitochalara longipes BDJ]
MSILQTLGRKLNGSSTQNLVEPKHLKTRKGGRRLTIESVPASNNSRLLGLPREIRDAIWRYACLNTRIHWWMNDGKLNGQLCRSSREHCQLRCTAWIQKPGNPPFRKMGIMGLLLSCRSIYSEIVDFLYELTIFDTREPSVIVFLPRLLLPKRINLIQEFDFLWTLRALPRFQIWEAVWKTLSGLEGLLRLTVELYLTADEDLWEPGHFMITKRVVRPRQFHLVLPGRVAQRVTGKFEGQNCTVISTESIDF